MTTTATIICACPPLPNPGMASVDLACYSILKEYSLFDNVNFVYLYTPIERNSGLSEEKWKIFKQYHASPIEYQCFRNKLDMIYKSDVIIFWGDFLHSRDYLYAILNILEQLDCFENTETVLEVIFDHLYLKKASAEVFSRVFLFGGTLIFNRASDYLDSNYNNHLERLISKSKRVWFRDVYSLAKVNRILDNNKSTLGVDCSLLLKEKDINILSKTKYFERLQNKKINKIAGIFIGRSNGINCEMIEFIRVICEKLHVKGEWFPWFASFVLPNYLSRIIDGFPNLIVNRSDEQPTLGDLLSRISKYEFIITDTYHVCLNAWRMGVPAICIGASISDATLDINSGWRFSWRDKRQTFYATYDAMEYYVFNEEIDKIWLREERIKALMELLKNNKHASMVSNNIKIHAAQVENELIKELRVFSTKKQDKVC